MVVTPGPESVANARTTCEVTHTVALEDSVIEPGPQPLLGPETLSSFDWEKITVTVPFGAAGHYDPIWPGAHQPSDGNTSLYDETYCKAHVSLIAHPAPEAPEASEAWLLGVGKRRARARVGDATPMCASITSSP